MNRVLTGLASSFLLIGVLLLVGGGSWIAHTRAFLARANVATGLVVRVDAFERRGADNDHYMVYYPIVEFRPASGDVQIIRGEATNYSKQYAVGDNVEVRYDPASPPHAVIPSFELWLVPLVVLGFGLFFSLMGGGVLGVPWWGRRRAAALRRSGTRILTQLQGVEKNAALTVNGRNPWRIVTQWIDPSTQRLHLFESENLWFDPTPHIHEREIPVFIERGNPRRYWVDISFLPKLGG